jgi:hypothetical protein
MTLSDYEYLFNYGEGSPRELLAELEQELRDVVGVANFSSCGGMSLNFKDAMGGRTVSTDGRPLRIPMDTVRFKTSKMFTNTDLELADTVYLKSGYYVIVPNERGAMDDRIFVEEVDGKPFRTEGRVRAIFSKEFQTYPNSDSYMVRSGYVNAGESVASGAGMVQYYPGGLQAGQPQEETMGLGTLIKDRVKVRGYLDYYREKINIVIYEGGEITVEDVLVTKEEFKDALLAVAAAKGKPFEELNYHIAYGSGESSQKLLNELSRLLGEINPHSGAESQGGGGPLSFDKAMGRTERVDLSAAELWMLKQPETKGDRMYFKSGTFVIGADTIHVDAGYVENDTLHISSGHYALPKANK